MRGTFLSRGDSMPKLDWTNDEVYLVAERAHSLYMQGRLREAATLFEGLVALDPENAYCRNALATVYLALDEARNALEQLHVAMRLDSGNMQARQRLCEALLQLGDTSAAAAELEFLQRMLPLSETRRLQLRLETAVNKR